jgi:hypothetical protein
MGPAISLTISTSEVAGVVELGRRFEGVEGVSEPTPLDARRALNAGLSPEDIKTGLELVTLVFESGTALLLFLKAMRDEKRARKWTGTVVVSDAGSGESLGRIGAETDDEALSRMTPK